MLKNLRSLAACAALLAYPAIYSTAQVAPQTQEAGDDESNPENHDLLKNLKFRNLGPAIAGGRVTSVAGVPGDPNIYYVGAASGGVFKSADGGGSWTPVFKHQQTASIGDIALAPSNSNFVWVGTGEANVRNDITDGAGVYFSPDAGHSWKFMGLRNAGQISRVLVDPSNADTVFVGALGNAWKPNSERGVFRSLDGGKTWKNILSVDDTTGAADLTMQPGNPKVLYAAMWHFRRYPWTLVDGGDSSGLYRSTDGGDTWKKLTEGLPKGPLGRIAVVSAPSNPTHLYALIAAKKGMLWQSFDMGDHWAEVSDNHALDVRPFYFSRMAVAPNDENKVYFLSFTMMESDDGGKTAHIADRGVHPDHHAIWIDPTNPKRIIQGNDGGVFLTLDGAKSWRFLDGLPLEQFYQVAIDSKQPYDICGGLQDNSAWCGISSNLGRSGVTNADWYTVVGGDGEYAVPAPNDPDIIYADAQNGFIERLVKSTHLSKFSRPYLESVEEESPAKLKYRFNWTSPIAVSESDANEVYLGANVLFKTVDGGIHWSPISDDLTRNDKSKQEPSGTPDQDLSGAESYDSIISITIAPTDPKAIWVGTDDGYVQLTRDGGKRWTNVTPHIPGAPEWARVYQIGVSPFQPGAAYVSFDAHLLGDRHPYVYKTSDYGQSWQSISAGLPEAPVFVVREDPNVRGFLVLGNDQGLFYSPDDGQHWNRLQANFPTVPVWDLKFSKPSHDLIAATHGLGIFVFDDIRPIEELTAQVQSSEFHLFNAGNGILFNYWDTDEDQPVSFSAPNAPRGAIIDYLLKAKAEATPEEKETHETPVKIVVTDQDGHLIATHFGPSNAGVNRFLWDLRYSGVRRLESAILPEPAAPGEPEESRYFTAGPAVLPGKYEVGVTTVGQTQKTSVTVLPDPNLHIDPADFRAQTEAALTMRSELGDLNTMIERIDGMEQQLAAFRKTVQIESGSAEKYASVLEQSKNLDKKLKALKDSVYNPDIQHNVAEDDIHAFIDFHGEVEGLADDLAESYDEPPNALIREKLAEVGDQLKQHLAAFNEFLKNDVAGYNKEAAAAGAPTVFGGTVVGVSKEPAIK